MKGRKNKMNSEFYWEIFKNTGSLSAYLLYKDENKIT
jgi:hypothetical protein